MNWQCLIQAVLAYFQCVGGFGDRRAQTKFTDCLARAGAAALAAGIPVFFDCMAEGNGDPPNPPSPPPGGYNPGDRQRCPSGTCAPRQPTG